MPKSVSFPTSLCCNCESEPSRYICRQCKESDKYLCFNCSILHPKVKAFKDHSVDSLDNTSGYGSSSSKSIDVDTVRLKIKEAMFGAVRRFRTYLEYVYDIISNKDSVDATVYYQTVALSVLAVVLSYSLLKAIFGSQAIIVVLILLYGYHYVETKANKDLKNILHKDNAKAPIVNQSSRGLYKVSQRRGFSKNSQMPSNLPSYSESSLPSTSIQVPDNNEEFKNEFWHDMECRPAKFRPRGRSYKANRNAEVSHENHDISK